MEKFRRGGKGRREQGVARREVGLEGKFFKLLRSKFNKVKIGIVFSGTAVIVYSKKVEEELSGWIVE